MARGHAHRPSRRPARGSTATSCGSGGGSRNRCLTARGAALGTARRHAGLLWPEPVRLRCASAVRSRGWRRWQTTMPLPRGTHATVAIIYILRTAAYHALRRDTQAWLRVHRTKHARRGNGRGHRCGWLPRLDRGAAVQVAGKCVLLRCAHAVPHGGERSVLASFHSQRPGSSPGHSVATI